MRFKYRDMAWRFENMKFGVAMMLLSLAIACTSSKADAEVASVDNSLSKPTNSKAFFISQIVESIDTLSIVNQAKLDTGKGMLKTMKEHLQETVDLRQKAEQIIKNQLPQDKSIEQFNKTYENQIEIFEQETQKEIDEYGFVSEVTELTHYLNLVNLNKDRIKEIQDKLSHKHSQKIKVTIAPCANGYEYEMYNYDITSIIENELKNIEEIELIPFPYKKLVNKPYQGIYDIKYANPIIENIDVDVLILSRFIEDYTNHVNKSIKWGYETRIIDCKSKVQLNSLSLKKANDFSKIKTHIEKNISTLIEDITSTKNKTNQQLTNQLITIT